MRLDKISRCGMWMTAGVFAAYPLLSGGRMMLTVVGLGMFTWLWCILLMIWTYFRSPKPNHDVIYGAALTVFLHMVALLAFVGFVFPLPAWGVAAVFGTIAYNLNPSLRRKTKHNPAQIAHSQSYTIIDQTTTGHTSNSKLNNHSSISDYF